MVVFKGHISRVVALTFLSSALGRAVGPSLGGALFALYGYRGPFFILGSYMGILGLMILAFMFSALSKFIKSKISFRQCFINLLICYFSYFSRQSFDCFFILILVFYSSVSLTMYCFKPCRVSFFSSSMKTSNGF